MGGLRKSIKIYFVSIILFIILTLIAAVFMYVTDIKENWSREIMLTLMSISAIFTGVLEAKMVGRRVLFVFLITVILFMVIVYGSVYMFFGFK